MRLFFGKLDKVSCCKFCFLDDLYIFKMIMKSSRFFFANDQESQKGYEKKKTSKSHEFFAILIEKRDKKLLLVYD